MKIRDYLSRLVPWIRSTAEIERLKKLFKVVRLAVDTDLIQKDRLVFKEER